MNHRTSPDSSLLEGVVDRSASYLNRRGIHSLRDRVGNWRLRLLLRLLPPRPFRLVLSEPACVTEKKATLSSKLQEVIFVGYSRLFESTD